MRTYGYCERCGCEDNSYGGPHLCLSCEQDDKLKKLESELKQAKDQIAELCHPEFGDLWELKRELAAWKELAEKNLDSQQLSQELAEANNKIAKLNNELRANREIFDDLHRDYEVACGLYKQTEEKLAMEICSHDKTQGERNEYKNLYVGAKERADFLQKQLEPCEVHFGARRACGQCYDSLLQHHENLKQETTKLKVKNKFLREKAGYFRDDIENEIAQPVFTKKQLKEILEKIVKNHDRPGDMFSIASNALADLGD